MEITHNKVFFLIILLTLIWGVLYLRKFSDNELIGFGYTDKYVNIAKTSKVLGAYTSTLIYGDYSLEKLDESSLVIDEVQREPLYPTALMIIDDLGLSYASIVYFQFAAILFAVCSWGIFVFKLFGKLVVSFFYIFLFLSSTIAFYSSVLYPYAFQFLLMTLVTISLYYGIKRKRSYLFILSSIFLALSIYERNVFLFCPIYLAFILIILKKIRNMSIKWKNIIILILLPYLLLSPWLIRNLSLGVFSMSQMTGYTLGYTYGDLESSFNNDLTELYDSNVDMFGSDGGTLGFIDNIVVKKSMSYADADKLVSTIVIDKMISNIPEVGKRIVVNILNYPSDLVSNEITINPNIGLEGNYNSRLNSSVNSFMSYFIFAISSVGVLILIRRRENGVFLLLTLSLILYSVLTSTVIVTFDSRYRGFVDLFIYSFSAYTVAVYVRFFGLKIRNYIEKKHI